MDRIPTRMPGTAFNTFARLFLAAITMWSAGHAVAGSPGPKQEFEPPDVYEHYVESIRRAAHTPSTDDAYLLLQSVLPGFAGMFFGPDGQLRVALTENGSEARAADVVADFFAARAEQSGLEREKPELVFTRAELDWGSLLAYRDAMTDALGEPGVVALDVDESCNCLQVGLDDMDRESFIREYALSAGIPARFLRYTKMSKAHRGQSLIDEFRPVIGATRMATAPGSHHGFPIFLGHCTGTATAVNAGSSGLLMASHCSVAFATPDRGFVWQNATFPSSRKVAIETIDPPLDGTLTGCPTGRACRLSDAAFAAFIDPADGHALGELARPQGFPCGVAPCASPLAMHYWGDRLLISSVGAAPIMGETKVKIGQATGATQGVVNRTCFSIGVSAGTPANLLHLCQSSHTAQFAPGDSGAPVVTDLSMSRVSFDGLAWGFIAPSLNSPLIETSTLFSPVGLVIQELGAMQFVANPPPPPTASRPDYCERAQALCLREIGTEPHITREHCRREYNACRTSGIP